MHDQLIMSRSVILPNAYLSLSAESDEPKLLPISLTCPACGL